MKKLMIAIALTAAAASPAFANGTRSHAQSNEPMTAPYASQQGYGAYASSDYGYAGTYASGQYVGTDPDANIRLQLQRNPTANEP
jgi:hypothetical protein